MIDTSQSNTAFNNIQDVKKFENGLSAAVSDLQHLLVTIGNSHGGIHSEEVDKIINRQSPELRKSLKQVLEVIQEKTNIGESVAEDVIREAEGLAPIREVEDGLTNYLSCLQEALRVIQRSNSNTMQDFEKEIHKNKKISKGVRGILTQEIKHLKELNIPGLKPTIQTLQEHLKEGVKDIESLRSNVKSLNLSKSVNNDKLHTQENQKSVKGLPKLDSTKKLLVGENALTGIGLSQMKELALAMKNALKALELERSNGRQAPKGAGRNAVRHPTESVLKLKETTKTVDKTNIQYAEKGLGEHTAVKIQQEKTADGITVENTREGEESAKQSYMREVAYDRAKDGELTPEDKKEAMSSIGDMPIVDGIFNQDPRSELRPSDVDNPNVESGKGKGVGSGRA